MGWMMLWHVMGSYEHIGMMGLGMAYLIGMASESYWHTWVVFMWSWGARLEFGDVVVWSWAGTPRGLKGTQRLSG